MATEFQFEYLPEEVIRQMDPEEQQTLRRFGSLACAQVSASLSRFFYYERDYQEQGAARRRLDYRMISIMSELAWNHLSILHHNKLAVNVPTLSATESLALTTEAEVESKKLVEDMSSEMTAVGQAAGIALHGLHTHLSISALSEHDELRPEFRVGFNAGLAACKSDIVVPLAGYCQRFLESHQSAKG